MSITTSRASLVAETGGVVSRHVSRSVDVVRGLAALGVIWGHSMYALNRPVELNGAFWVWVFLPLSGYLVARGFADGGYDRSAAGAIRFLRNRALRILPLAWLALAIGAVLAWRFDALPATTVRQFLFAPPGNDMSLVGPLWTVAAELQFYVAALVIIPLLALRPGLWRVLLGIALAVGATFAAKAWIDAGYDNAVQPKTLIGNLPFFAFGVMLACVERAPVRMPRALKTGIFLLLVATAWYLQNYKIEYFWRWHQHPQWPFGGAAALALAIAFVTVAFEARDPRPRWWERGPAAAVVGALAWCGFHTYGIYVWHSVLATANRLVFGIPTGPRRLALLLGAVVIAPISYRYFERWFLRFKQNRQLKQMNGAGLWMSQR
jgi:peptidoglycan/LPS O-acetylase OafA/YrhL